MRLLLSSLVALALAAGPAAAQGTFSPGGKPGSTFGSPGTTDASKPRGYLSQPAQPSPSRPKTYGVPEAPKAPGFEPYKPFSGSSVYSRPSGAPRPDSCETSVYVNACGKKK